MRLSHANSAIKINDENGIHVLSPRILFIAALVVFITILHFGTGYTKPYQHIIFKESYLLPLILGGC